ncbi:MAG: hypothetical protein KY439_08025, partial [Actinobacteria bacterium]|nr:hypothetical protein [Actinomycetota bacterium]
GAGGGGGGGVVKVVAPIPTGVVPDLSNGVSGNDSLCWDTGAGDDGQPGRLVLDETPASLVRGFPVFWQKGTKDAPTDPAPSVAVPFVAAGLGGSVSKPISVAVCAIAKPISAGEPLEAQLAPLFAPHLGAPASDPNLPAPPPSPSPVQPTASNPCGTLVGATATKLGQATVTLDRVEPPNAQAIVTVPLPTPPTSEYLGLYTIALRPRTAGNNCLTSGDAGGVNDDADCFVERLPAGVDRVIGVDAGKPTAAIPTPTHNTAFTAQRIAVSFTASDPGNLSGYQRAECRSYTQGTTPPAFAPCSLGPQSLDLQGGDGIKVIELKAIDNAGNTFVAPRTVILDQNAPDATVTFTPGTPDGDGGWYRGRPAIELGGYDDGALDRTTIGPKPYAYHFDNGSDTECTADPCPVPSTTLALLQPGEHTVSYTAIDSSGNRFFDDDDPRTPSPMPSRPFKFDDQAPRVVLSTVPRAPDELVGTEEWFSVKPFVALGAVDQLGASGVRSIEYRLAPSPTYLTYDATNPPRLDNGIHTLCYRATDGAGNVSTESCKVIRVDASAPSGSLTVDGFTSPVPTGQGGWFDTVPAVELGGYSDGAGVGAPASGRFRYRVDNGGFVECDSPCSVPPADLGTGRHQVAWSAVDRFGNRRVEEGVRLMVDVDPPVPALVVSPGRAGGNNGWHDKLPFVEIGASDQRDGSGVAAITYTLNGGSPQPYTGSFRLGPGLSNVCAWATDVAGNASAAQCVSVKADIDDPFAAITAPPPDGGADWYLTNPSVAMSATDPAPGAGVDQAHDPDVSDLCSYNANGDNPRSASGVCVSVDGARFMPVTGPLTLPEGVHTVRSFAVDVAGRRSTMQVRRFFVDRSAPVTSLRTSPPAAAAAGWWRELPLVTLRAVDGDQNSGVGAIVYSLGGGTWVTYTKPFTLPEGVNTVLYRAVDLAGRQETARELLVPVDVTSPQVKATSADPQVWYKLLDGGGFLGEQQAKLHWTVTEKLSKSVRIAVIVYDETGYAVRRIDGGVHQLNSDTVGSTINGFTLWDGKDQSLTGFVGVGVYHYRVVAVDEAGNPAQSGESSPLQVKAEDEVLSTSSLL